MVEKENGDRCVIITVELSEAGKSELFWHSTRLKVGARSYGVVENQVGVTI